MLSVEAPYLIGIAGGSCSGKTTVAELLTQKLKPSGTIHITLDSYYRDVSRKGPEYLRRHNFDHPDALDHPLIVSQLRAIALGKVIDKPIYDFETHARRADAERIRPNHFVIVEGLFALYWQEIRRYFSTKVFIDAPHDVCLKRRMERDYVQRGRTPEDIRHRYNAMARPMFDLHVLPTRKYADTIVSGCQPPEVAADAVIQHINATKKECS